MSHEIDANTEKDFTKNWVNSSRFLFYLQVFCILAFVLGGCYRLYNQRYAGKPEVWRAGQGWTQPRYMPALAIFAGRLR